MVQFKINMKKKILFIVCLISHNLFAQNINYSNQIDELNQTLAQIKANNLLQQQSCYKKFFINACLNKVNQEMYALNDKIDNQILILKQQQRKIEYTQAEDRRKKIADNLSQEALNNLENEEENTKFFEQKQQIDQNRKTEVNSVTKNKELLGSKKIIKSPQSNKIVKDIKAISNTNSNKDYQNKLQEMEDRKLNLEQRNKQIDEYLKKNNQ